MKNSMLNFILYPDSKSTLREDTSSGKSVIVKIESWSRSFPQLASGFSALANTVLR